MALSLNRLPLAGKIGVGAVLCALIGVAYYVLKPTPCELVTNDLCGFTDMTGEACPTLEKAMADMGADEAWCQNVIAGKEGLEPEETS